MSIGGDLYDQHCMRRQLGKVYRCRTRAEAIELAECAMNSDGVSDFPTMGLVESFEENERRARRLYWFCQLTRFLPWCVVRYFAP